MHGRPSERAGPWGSPCDAATGGTPLPSSSVPGSGWDAGATLLRAEGLCKSYPTRSGPLVVLRAISLRVEARQSLVITGPSGSGKSTLLNVLGTLEPPTEGVVEIVGVNPLSLPEPELARFRNLWIGFIFQEHYLLPQCNALENVLLPALVGGRDRSPPRGPGQESAVVPSPQRPGARLRPRNRLQRAQHLLERVGLGGRLEHTPAELSGGERQRVAIARALINEPCLVLADEPTGNLDRVAADAVAELLAELQAAEGFGLILVTHSERLAARFARRVELVDGRLVEVSASRPETGH